MSDKTYTLRDNSTGEELELKSKSGSIGPDVVDVRPVYACQFQRVLRCGDSKV